jgi:DNA-binding GntR family transcriptional regulator
MAFDVVDASSLEAPLSAVQARTLREIVTYIRRENLPAGTHLREWHLAKLVGTSRSPVQAALNHLAALGLVEHDRNRGFFLQVPATSLADFSENLTTSAEDPLYLQIADGRLRGVIPDTVLEADLMRQFNATRNAVHRALSRIQQEGWVERAKGHGWHFTPMINSIEAYEESYAFRLMIEPAALLTPGFRPDPDLLADLRRQQQHIVQGGYKTMTPAELFEANARFHETLAACSGNRFVAQAVRRMDQLRRLVELGQAKQRPARKSQAEEHLGILEKVEQGDFLAAATLMRAHLEGARRQKAVSTFLVHPHSRCSLMRMGHWMRI